jgi:hypothetical protein
MDTNSMMIANDLKCGVPYMIIDAECIIHAQDNLPIQPGCKWVKPNFFVETGEIVFYVGSTDLPNVDIFTAFKAIWGELRTHVFISSRTGESFTIAIQDKIEIPFKRIWE